jgi:hypothetical protein
MPSKATALAIRVDSDGRSAEPDPGDTGRHERQCREEGEGVGDARALERGRKNRDRNDEAEGDQHPVEARPPDQRRRRAPQGEEHIRADEDGAEHASPEDDGPRVEGEEAREKPARSPDGD